MKNKLPIDISILLSLIIAFALWLCQETLNQYLATVLNIAIISLILFVAYRFMVGLHSLAMLRLDYLYRRAEVRAVGRLTVTLNAGQSLVMVEGDQQTLVTAPAVAALPAPSQVELVQNLHKLPEPNINLGVVPEIRHDLWMPEIIAPLKTRFDKYNQAMSSWTTGNPGSGKTVVEMWKTQEMIKPFDHADIVVLDRKAYMHPDKWGNLNVLADTIEKYPAAMEQLNQELRQRTDKDDPLFVIVDEIDEANKVYAEEFNRQLYTLQSVGRELKVNVSAIGQSPLTKGSGIDSVQKTFFQLRTICGVDGVLRFLKRGEHTFDKRQKEAYISQLEEISHEPFIGFCYPDRVCGKPFMFVTPHIEKPQIKQTRRRSILDLSVRPEMEHVNVPIWNKNGRTDGRTALLVEGYLNGELAITRQNVGQYLRDRGHTMSNDEYQIIKTQVEEIINNGF